MLYTKPVIYFIEDDDVELHMFSTNVGVCWHTEQARVKKRYTNQDGVITNTVVTTFQRIGKPYIRFVWLREGEGYEPYIDDDSPVDGGLDAASAREYGEALIRAADYLAGMAV